MSRLSVRSACHSLLAFLLLAGTTIGSPLSAAADETLPIPVPEIITDTYEINHNGAYDITGNISITIAANVTEVTLTQSNPATPVTAHVLAANSEALLLTINGIHIRLGYLPAPEPEADPVYVPGIDVAGAEVTLQLQGDNSITGSDFVGVPAIRVPAGKSLKITGTDADSLTVTGGTASAGIGGGAGLMSTGTTGGETTITGGLVTATGGVGGAGIGGGSNGIGGTTTIEGGYVTATGGMNGAGIGGGVQGAGGNTTIARGDVTVTGGDSGAGIGGGGEGAGGTTTITGGDVTVTGGSFAAGIGGGAGLMSTGTTGGETTITGGVVTSTGGTGGAGIGGGLQGAGGTTTITGGTIVASDGGDFGSFFTGAAGIGKGAGGASSGTTAIDGGSIQASGDTSAFQNSAGTSVYLLELTVKELLADDHHMNLPDTTLLYKDGEVLTDEDGKLYLYVPVGDYALEGLQLRFPEGYRPLAFTPDPLAVSHEGADAELLLSNLYQVVWVLNGGTMEQESAMKVEYDGSVDKPTPDPQRTGYTFDGWYTDPNGMTRAAFPAEVRTDTGFYARWIANPLTLSEADLPNGDYGEPYHADLPAADNGTGSYTYVVTDGQLPDGLELHGRALSGIAEKAGSYTFEVTAVDTGSGSSVSQTYSIVIVGPGMTVPADGHMHEREVARAGILTTEADTENTTS